MAFVRTPTICKFELVWDRVCVCVSSVLFFVCLFMRETRVSIMSTSKNWPVTLENGRTYADRNKDKETSTSHVPHPMLTYLWIQTFVHHLSCMGMENAWHYLEGHWHPFRARIRLSPTVAVAFKYTRFFWKLLSTFPPSWFFTFWHAHVIVDCSLSSMKLCCTLVHIAC